MGYQPRIVERIAINSISEGSQHPPILCSHSGLNPPKIQLPVRLKKTAMFSRISHELTRFVGQAVRRRRLPPLHQSMLRNFNLARADEPKQFKSRHWDVFRSDYERCLYDVDMWRAFRRSGITEGYDDSASSSGSLGQRATITTDNQRDLGHRTWLPEHPESSEVTNYIVQLYHQMCTFAGRDFVETAYGNDIGEPCHFVFESKKLNNNDLTHLYFTKRITQTLPPANQHSVTFCEIGGGVWGYGGSG